MNTPQRTRLAVLLCCLFMAPLSLLGQARGRVLSSDASRQLNHPIEVRIEFQGRIIGSAFTDGRGNFTFGDVDEISTVYALVDEPGFRPVRVEVPIVMGRGQAPPVVIILDSIAEARSRIDPDAVDLGELLAEIPDDALEAFQQAGEASEAGDAERTLALLEEAVAIAPDFYDAQNALGVEYQTIGRRQDAIRHFLFAKDLNPNAAAPVLSLGVLYLQDSDRSNSAGRIEEAGASLEQSLAYLEEAVGRDPRSAAAQYYLGAAYYKTGQLDSALDRLNRALALDREFHDARLLLFNVHIANRDAPAALEQLTIYLELYPDSPQREMVEHAKEQLEEQLRPR